MRNISINFIVIIFLTAFSLNAQPIIDKIEPPNWWTGMNLNQPQLMIYGEDLNNIDVKFNDERITVQKIHNITNPSYAFIDVNIPEDLPPGDYKIIFTKAGESTEFNYSILSRNKEKTHGGFDQSDVIYLIMPDRFVNGNPSNDIVEGYIGSFDRSNERGRHGGDIEGIISRLDYIKETGFTALWLNPLVENNVPAGYHGYHATDLYKIDPRLGTNELYKKLVDEAHKRGLKVILDHIANHIHINHPWMKNLPMEDWVNHSPEDFEITRHDKMSIVDVHSDGSVLENSTTGWFTEYLPDLNQRNPYMAKYIIQNTIWWMEYAGIDGIREDTYPYADPEFMSHWAEAVLNEYPNTNIVGEVWNGNPILLATYQEKSKVTAPFDTRLPAVTDFGLSDVLSFYLRGTKNISAVYETIAMDYAYYDPYNLVTFIDNHDIVRGMFAADGNTAKFKTAFKILLTTRGIPQILYATEIGMKGGADHGSIRTDFPGGFPGDKRNAFTSEGRNDEENEIYEFFKKLLKIRSENPALSKGKLIHFPPSFEYHVYTYFRQYEDNKCMVIVNDYDFNRDADLSMVKHQLEGAEKIIDLETGEEFIYSGDLQLRIKAKEAHIFKIIY
jgi:neopullulanase